MSYCKLLVVLTVDDVYEEDEEGRIKYISITGIKNKYLTNF